MLKIKKLTFMIFVISLCLIFTGCAMFAQRIYSQAFARIEDVPDDEFNTYITWKDIDHSKYSRENVYFYSAENRLQGFVYGESNNNGLIIISQGLGNTADHYLALILFFVDRGWRVLAFNNTGVSRSEGDSVRGLTQSLFDLNAALDFVYSSSKLNDLPIMLVGHSWGGFAACTVLTYSHNINAVVSFAGFNNGNEVINELAVVTVGRIYNLFSNHVKTIERRLFGDAVELTAIDGINNSNIPVMIVQSSDDDVISAETTSIYAHRSKITNPNAEIVFFDGEQASGHEFVFYSNEQREYVNRAVASWLTFKARNRNASKHQWAEEFNFDVFKANELNMELMERINDFFLNAR